MVNRRCFPTIIFLFIYLLFHISYMYHSLHPPWFDHSNNIFWEIQMMKLPIMFTHMKQQAKYIKGITQAENAQEQGAEDNAVKWVCQLHEKNSCFFLQLLHRSLPRWHSRLMAKVFRYIKECVQKLSYCNGTCMKTMVRATSGGCENHHVACGAGQACFWITA